MTDEEIERWMGLMLCWLDLDPMNYIYFAEWVEDQEDP